MKLTKITRVYQDKKQLFTENLEASKGVRIYGERIIKKQGKEYRSWNPYRSKLAAAILNGLDFDIKEDYNVLYLGAATGTTVGHISDILYKGVIFAVENSPIAMKKLLKVCEKRPNIIPILNDAFHPERYENIVTNLDYIYQDISQRNQAEIFIDNIKKYLNKNQKALLMVKARSIDVSLKPKKAYEQVCKKLKNNKLKIFQIVDLDLYEKDHAAILVGV